MSQPSTMDAMFGDALATRGKGADTGVGTPVPVPATFTEPGVPAQSTDTDTAPPAAETPATPTEPAKEGAEVEVPPIGGKTFDGKSNKRGGRGPLTQAEVLRLNQAESQIRAFGKAAANAGEAFEMIKKDGLHHHYGLTWAQYTFTHWGLSASQADRLIAAAPVMRELSIAYEGTARELVPVYREWGMASARAIWSGAKEGADGKPTAKLTKIAVKGVLERTQGDKKAPAADKLSSLAKNVVNQAAEQAATEAKARKAAATALRRAQAEEIVDAELVEEQDVTDDAPAWLMPEDAVRHFSDLFVERAADTGETPEAVMWETFNRLRKEPKAPASQ